MVDRNDPDVSYGLTIVGGTVQSPDTPLFRSIAAARTDLESAIREQVELIRRPGNAGWEGAIGAAITLPLTGVAAVLAGMAHVTMAATDEREWERMFGAEDAVVTDGPVTDIP